MLPHSLLTLLFALGCALELCADVVLLKGSHRLLEGEVTKTEDRVTVTSRGRSVGMPVDLVDRIRKTKQDVYKELRTELARRDPDEHYKLALWCKKYELYDEAIDECLAVLQLKSTHRSARALKNTIENIQKRQKDPSAPKPLFKPTSFDWDFERWRTRQDKAHLKQFHDKIQMIVLQGCGAGQCHGGFGYRGSFRLTRLKSLRPNSPKPTQKNLVAVFRVIDQKSPERSPLLTFPLKRPPDHPIKVYDSEYDKTYRDLYEWVMGLKTPYGGANLVSKPPAQGTQGKPKKPPLQLPSQ